jgi:site-specific recombinase XerD
MEASSQAHRPPKLLDQLRAELRVRHMSLNTEESYVGWARRYILFHGKRHPREMGPEEVRAFLSHLAVERGVSASTQNQAKAALLFLYRQVLGVDLPWLTEVVQAKERRRLPVVLNPGEVRALLDQLDGTMGLLAALLYGTGLRLLCTTERRHKDSKQPPDQSVASPLTGMKVMARSARAAMVRDGFTPGLAEIAAPSMT